MKKFYVRLTRVDSEKPHRATVLANGEVVLDEEKVAGADAMAAVTRAIDSLEKAAEAEEIRNG